MRWIAMLAIANAFAAFAMFAKADEPSDDGTREVRAEMLERNNAIRTSRGLKPHRESVELMAAAQDHASYMARTRSFSHYSNGGPSGRAARHGFGAGVRENIGYGYATVGAMFTTWTNSGGHFANLTSGTTDAGFGWAISGDGTPYWVAVYGTPPTPPREDAPEETSTDTQPQWRPARRFLGWFRGR